jgi:formylglycine-generating enzyme required for sulfatase activity
VDLSWYEALAYVRWLSRKTGKPYRLPTDAEWERAARDKDGRIYPWKGSWRPDIANTKETGLGRTTAVGIFPLDMSVCGAQDLSGNIREWCQTRFRDEEKIVYMDPYQSDDGREYLGGEIEFHEFYVVGVGRLTRNGDVAEFVVRLIQKLFLGMVECE